MVNTITYIKSSKQNIHWTQRNITYQHKSNKKSPASPRSPTLHIDLNDAMGEMSGGQAPGTLEYNDQKLNLKSPSRKCFLPVHTQASVHPTGAPGCDLLPRLANRTKANFTERNPTSESQGVTSKLRKKPRTVSSPAFH